MLRAVALLCTNTQLFLFLTLAEPRQSWKKSQLCTTRDSSMTDGNKHGIMQHRIRDIHSAWSLHILPYPSSLPHPHSEHSLGPWGPKSLPRKIWSTALVYLLRSVVFQSTPSLCQKAGGGDDISNRDPRAKRSYWLQHCQPNETRTECP